MKRFLLIFCIIGTTIVASATTYYSNPAGGNFSSTIWSLTDVANSPSYTIAGTTITSSDDVLIQGGTLLLNLATGSTYCRNITIQNGATVKLTTASIRSCTFTGDIIVQNGGTFQVGDAPTSTITAANIFVNLGGKIWSNLPLDAGAANIVYFFITGTQLVCNGIIGNGATSEALAFQPEGANVTFSGSGTFDCARIRKITTTNTITNLTIQLDINLRLGAANLTNGANSTVFNVTIDAGKTVKLVAGYNPTSGFGNIGLDGGAGTSNRRQGTYTINGNLECENLYIVANNASCLAADAYKMIIGSAGSATVRTHLLGNTGAAGAGLPELQILSGGLLKILGGTPTTSIDATGTKNKWTFDANATVEYGGATQTIEPNFGSYGNLKISGSGIKSIAAATIVNGVLNVANGALTAGFNLSLGASASATFAPATTLNITGGKTDFNNKSVTLQSSAAGTAKIATIIGDNMATGLVNATNLTVQRYFTAKRAYRFLGHPFTTSIALSQLMDNANAAYDIAITGSGTGFTGNGATTNPSAFWFDATAASGSQWTAFTNTDGTGVNAVNQYQGTRIFVRGRKTEGLTTAPYTPSDVTVDMTGTLNTGDKTVALIYNNAVSPTFNLIANPYPSQIDINATTRGSNIGGSFYIWDATAAGTNGRGAYINQPFGSSYILPMGAAFFATTSSNTNNTIAFTEAIKTTTTPIALFGTSNINNTIELRIEKNGEFWDRLLLLQNKEAAIGNDKWDGEKLSNPDLNFYTINSANTKLSIDARDFATVKTDDDIPLGFDYTGVNNFNLKVNSSLEIAGKALYLRDKFLNTSTQLKEGTVYNFDVTADANSKGANRFELAFKSTPINAVTDIADALNISVSPNPAVDKLFVKYNAAEKGSLVIKVIGIKGEIIKTMQKTNQQSGTVTIDVTGFAKGIYVVQASIGTQQITQQVIIQ